MTRYGYTPDGIQSFEGGFVSTTSTDITVFKGVVIGEFEITTQYKCSYCGRLTERDQKDQTCRGCGAPLERPHD